MAEKETHNESKYIIVALAFMFRTRLNCPVARALARKLGGVGSRVQSYVGMNRGPNPL